MDVFLVFSMFLCLIACLMMGFPVAFTLAGIGLIFGLLGAALGVMDFDFLSFLPNRIFENIIRNDLLFAIPLFISMGVILEKSKLAEDMLLSMGQVFHRVRGGLGVSIMLVGALLAASTGIVGATVVTMGLLSLPTMIRQGYDKRLASGIIAAAGTLGQIIPPSIVLILLADTLSSAYQEAQRLRGVFTGEPMSAGELFAGALIPGLLLVGLYLAYQISIAFIWPHWSPSARANSQTSLDTAPNSAIKTSGSVNSFIAGTPDRDRGAQPPQASPSLSRQVARALLPPLLLILSVLGAILSGIATPTEAASFGAVGAILLAANRTAPQTKAPYAAFAALAILFLLGAFSPLRSHQADPLLQAAAFILAFSAFLAILSCLKTLYKSGILRPALDQSLTVSSMIFSILIGAALFSLSFRGLGGDEFIFDLLRNLPGGSFGALIFVMLLMFILGFFLDFIEITFIIVPVVAPILLSMDGLHGPIWLGVLMAMNLQTSFLTPPFGFALFYLRGVAPLSIKTKEIYAGVLPFIVIQLIMLSLIILFPQLVTWLPNFLKQF